MTATDSEIPRHLRDNHAPVTEELSLTDLEVTGTIPPELDGRYLRNGANPVTGMSDHPFLGDGMIHGVRLRDGKAEWYRNRYVQTPFIDDPERPIIEDDSGGRDMTASKANTHIVGHAGQILALEEGHFPYVLNGDLATVGPTDYNGKLTTPFTAHPKICPTTGEMLAFGYNFIEPYMTYLRVSADGNLVQSEQITTAGPTMVHDFNVTENHVVFMDLPACFDLELALQGIMPIAWNPDYAARLGVMPRNGTDAQVEWYDIDPCYVFHPLNSYEDGDTIVLDVARYEHIWRDGAMDFPHPVLWRWVIDRKAGTVTETQIDDRPGEFPRVADSVVGRRHRYGYLVGLPEGSDVDPMDNAGAILKYDREADTRTSIELQPGQTPGESVFVPAEGATEEDEGYLMTYVHDAATNTSSLSIFDAETMSSEPVAAVHLPRVPSGFHGSWVPSSVAD